MPMPDKKAEDYYVVLGVPRTASSADIKAAYRAKAKELHPDINKDRNATARFQILQEAFSVLGSPERRQLYDQGNYEAAVDPGTEATEAEFDPVPCVACGCISAQPRFVQYERVISFVFSAHKTSPAGVFCPSCVSKRLFVSTLVTGSVGWISIPGFFWSISAVFGNLCGGTKPAGVNAFLLSKQAAYFMQQGNANLAYALAAESLDYFKKATPGDSDYSMGKAGAEVARLIENRSRGNRVRFRSRWSGWSAPARYALGGLAIPAAVWAAIFNSSSSSNPRSQEVSHYSSSQIRDATASTPAPEAEPDVDVVGRDGQTYRVSMSIYRRLKPIYDELHARQEGIKASIESINWRHTAIEERRATLDTRDSYALDSFNQIVDTWNRDNERLKERLTAFDREVDAYNQELERVGRIIR